MWFLEDLLYRIRKYYDYYLAMYIHKLNCMYNDYYQPKYMLKSSRHLDETDFEIIFRQMSDDD